MIHIQNVIDASIAAGRKKKEKTGWYVTDLSSCLRGVYLKRKNPELDKFDERTLRVFKCGEIFEDFVVSHVPKELIIATQERLEWPEFHLSGRCDLIIKSDDGPLLLEIKSQNSRAFHWNRKRGGANEAHVEQVSLYWSKLKDKYPGLKCAVVYISKDDLCVEVYPVKPTDEFVASALAKAKLLEDCWKNGTLPPEAPEGDWRSTYCSCHAKCLEEYA